MEMMALSKQYKYKFRTKESIMAVQKYNEQRTGTAWRKILHGDDGVKREKTCRQGCEWNVRVSMRGMNGSRMEIWATVAKVNVNRHQIQEILRTVVSLVILGISAAHNPSCPVPVKGSTFTLVSSASSR